MPSNTIDFNSLDLPDASGHVDMSEPQLDALPVRGIAICTMAAPAILEYQLPADGGTASWELSPAAALTAGIGVWAAACGAALYGALG